MDKKKIISSLTLAGMLATSVAGSGVFAAETSDPATKALGEYSKLITGKVAVPFILQSEADRVTGKDVKVAFPGKTVTIEDDAVLKTGDVVNVNGEPRTIVIYGDTNCDGKINIMDAVTTLNHVKGKATLTGAAFAAANLNNNKDIDIMDAVGALNVVKGKAEYGNYAKAPEAEVSVLKDVVIKNATTIDLFFDMDPNGYSYTLFDKDGERLKGQLISGASKDSETGLYKYEITSTATLTENSIAILDKAGNTIATKNIVYRALNVPTPEVKSGSSEKDPTVIAINDENVKNFDMLLKISGTTANVNAVETTVTVTLTKSNDNNMTVEASAKLPANTVSTSVNFGDLSKLDDGDYNIAVKATDANGNIAIGKVGYVKVTKASVAPVIFADATRTKINKATVTVNANKTGLTYYAMAKVVGEKAPTASELVKKENHIPSNNEITVTSEAQTIYVVAVNTQGTVSNIATTEIASDSVAKLASVEPITLQGTKYIWTDSNTKDNVKGYQVRVLKVTSEGSEIVYETPVTDPVTDKEYDITKIAKDNYTNGAKFKISVKALSNNKDYVDSSVVVATGDNNLYAVPTISNVTTSLTGTKLTWNGVADAKSFTIKLYKAFATESSYEYKEVNKVEDIANTNRPNYEYDLKSIIEKEGVGKYTATVTAIANDNSIKVDSTESDNVKTPGSVTKIYVAAAAPTDVTMKVENTKVTARFSPIVIPGVNNSDITYQVRVDAKQADGTYTKGTLTPVTPAMATDEKDKVEFNVPGDIANGSDYRITIFATVTETVDGKVVAKTEVKTKAQDFSTPAAMIPQETYTVRMLTEEDSSFPTDDKTYIGILNGVMKVEGETDVTNAPNYNTIKAVVSQLNAGDTITVDGKGKITDITVKANNSQSIELDLAKVAEKAELTINTNDSHAIKVLGTVKSVKVKGENGVADLAGLTVSDGVTVAKKDEQSGSSIREVVANGQNVTVKAGTKVTIPASATVTLNGVTLTTGTATATDVAITVTANSNDELTIDGSGIAITIVANADKTVNFKGTQSGDVTVANAAKKATLTLKTLDDSSIEDLVINSAMTTVNIVDVYMLKTGTLTGTQGTIVSDATIVDGNVQITPVSGNATVKYAGDEITDISGNVKVEIGGLNVAENDAVTTETALTEGNSYVTVNEGVNATYTLTAGTGNGVMTITLTAGTITLGESIVYPAGTTTINGITIKTGGATDIQKTATGLSINAGSSDVEVTAAKGETIAFTGNQTGSVKITNNGIQTVSVTGSGLKNLVINKGIVDISGANVENGKIYANVGASIKTNKDKEIKYYAGDKEISINIKNCDEGVIAEHYDAGVVKLSGKAKVTFNTEEKSEVSDNGQDMLIPLVNNVKLQLSNDNGSVSWVRDGNGLVTIDNIGDLTITKTK